MSTAKSKKIKITFCLEKTYTITYCDRFFQCNEVLYVCYYITVR